MQTHIKIEANEIEKVEGRSFYNHIWWKLKKTNWLGITHLEEKYDDVIENPVYTLGTMNDDKFTFIAYGEGDPVPEEKIGCGGVWIDIDLISIYKDLA